MLRSTLSSWREYLTPISNKSTFLSTGQITPDEFVQAGDYLVHMFPTWSWNGSMARSDISIRDFLPEDKQFLVSRKVPSTMRAQDLFNIDYNDELDDDEEVDVEPNNIDTKESKEKQMVSSNTDSTSKQVEDIDDMLKNMELDETEDGDDEIIMKTEDNSKDQKRYYDLYITYSTSYRVPKMYIVGFNSQGTPLTPDEMFEDISVDYRQKTATIEKLPFFKDTVLSVSIHPCKHANVMKILLEKIRKVNERKRLENKTDNSEAKPKEYEDDWEDLQDDINDTLRVDQYLIVFLKFITSVTPSIQHDYTMDGW
ncbi:similar to Saccharomyces cerevisiae YNR007C ATG3 E2-like enzyme involved in autophagy and the cytoplasm-to-vacuole targeting (Cvt) pathway [Maudiozyma barnettii]|uniref:Autophagy-related protein 3 n=1 Tax=Maudiozyma barnettii TaxID=61262 RepID=A0A8H2VH89_9SACH|nr:Atg3p [Kazachstania barnettii]CAB4255396.1 similar to Saccharomyces cerevisiae YNR007C ATG3 E2-like enzyme involved in autophagy and the cytoplasm-to-vacuole targeting (Cvt) pathway [Kazachstania barnettii]CAD1783802.1 similar to Saccharomyces cerevisiae YNR007C ATG3 E2-like enzyme involved in autophagy and the cytoplasm-to-vacuole targeting (Cvt) pathway [Kazachstania barnettii]